MICRATPVTVQPGSTFHFNNTFLPQPNEVIRTVYECQEGCSDCCGRRTTVALTNSRLISRVQDPCPCCCCCVQGPHHDKTIFLDEIGVLFEETRATSGSCVALLASCVTCTCICFLCGGCCGDKPKSLGIKGGYGDEHVVFSTTQYAQAVNDLTAMIVQAKSP